MVVVLRKEILKQAHSVFKTGVPKMMTYDGRYKLGCEGTLYILIENFNPNKEMLQMFKACLLERVTFEN